MKAPRGALKPPPSHELWLDEALGALSAGGAAGERDLRRALGRIDQLSDGMRRVDATSYPPGFRERLVGARLDLNLGDPEGCRTELGRLAEELRDYWSR